MDEATIYALEQRIRDIMHMPECPKGCLCPWCESIDILMDEIVIPLYYKKAIQPNK